jgi:soluble lytic murein transglycosylase-like protein
MIEAALEEQGYFRTDIPLTYEEQDYLQTACEEFDIPYPLALAVIQQETDFRNVMGDDGRSAGYMQIQARWHADRMDKLGITDLMDPAQNFRVGCSFLAELLDRYSLEDALTYYNSGHTGSSEYAESVIRYMDKYQEGANAS